MKVWATLRTINKLKGNLKMVKRKQNKYVSRVRYIEYDRTDKSPDLAVYALDRARKVIKESDVDRNGVFSLADNIVVKADSIIIGPKCEDVASQDRKLFATYRPNQYQAIMETTGRFEIPKRKWYPWIRVHQCVSGSVSHCHGYPWLSADLFGLAKLDAKFFSITQPRLGGGFPGTGLSDFQIARPALKPAFRHHCHEVCDGLVEVYRRTCCCRPWVIYDPRLGDLLAKLERLREVLPPPPWPPRPQPDPVPFEKLTFLKGATLNEDNLSAEQDLLALHALPAESVPAYINARPHLFCHCGTTKKVASGFIQPDGEFSICWREPRRFFLFNCHDEYAYVVKQVINGETVTIYDGVAANKWFHSGTDANLVSYHPRAQSCRHNEFPGEGAFVVLQDITDTPSFHLKTPDADSWDGVATPSEYNHGLAFPAANATAAKGKYRDRNWGGTLKLRYHFSEEMKGVGAKYYRVSVVAANSNGDPTGDRTYLAPTQWMYFENLGGGNIENRQVSLGPHSPGGQFNLYEIPYDADHAWHSGLYHAILDTTDFAEGRFLLTVEVFDAAGQLLRPVGTADPGGSASAAYTYRRWYQEVGPTAEVPFAALTHMLWWDNRKAVAVIEDLRINGTENTAECQFLVGPGGTQFSVGYRAYHPEPMFMLDHRIWWRRGLGGPSGILTNPHPNPNNVGVPMNPPHQSGSNSFATMLAGLGNPKCSFSVNLHTNVKTFNGSGTSYGSGTLNGLDDWDQAAFALEMTS